MKKFYFFLHLPMLQFEKVNNELINFKFISQNYFKLEMRKNMKTFVEKRFILSKPRPRTKKFQRFIRCGTYKTKIFFF